MGGGARGAWAGCPRMLRVGLFAVLFVPSLGRANGQRGHNWVTAHAIPLLPEGELKDILTEPDHAIMWQNGSMFPDGGYAVNDAYGEWAHWEEFQDPYLQWIRDNYSPPWSEEAEQHIAFLMGMASHGMSDQLFDAMFVEWSKVYDAETHDPPWNFDTASDVIFASVTESVESPEDWAPRDVMIELYQSVYDHQVDEDTLEMGQGLVKGGFDIVNAAAEHPETVAMWSAQYPWGAISLLDPNASGSPPSTSPIVAKYWMALWDRLAGVPWNDTPVLGTFPAFGPLGQPTDASSRESRFTIVFSRDLKDDTVTTDVFSVVDQDGVTHPIELVHYYRNHVVHVQPVGDWDEDTDYTVTVGPELASEDGVALGQTLTFEFSTRPLEDDAEEPPVWPSPDASTRGCVTVGGAMGRTLGIVALVGGLLGFVRRRVFVQ